MSFIHGTGMLIDCDDNITEAKNLKAEPFTLIYHTPQCREPKLVSKDNADNPVLTYTAMLKKIADTKKMCMITDSVAEIDDVGDDSAKILLPRSLLLIVLLGYIDFRNENAPIYLKISVSLMNELNQTSYLNMKWERPLVALPK